MNENEEVVEKKKLNVFKIIFACFVLLLIVSIIGFTIFSVFHKVDYVILEPGDAISVNESINIDFDNLDDPNGDIKFLTVLVSAQRPSLFEYLKAKYLDENTTIYPWREVNGTLSSDESQRLSALMMKQSQNAAAVVALETVGCPVPRNGTGATVIEVSENSPAAKIGLKPGDTITKVNDVQVNLDSEAVEEIQRNSIGSEVEITYENTGGKQYVKTTKLIENKEIKGKAFLGVSLVTRDFDLDFPIDIEFEAGEVTGPSAGLAFTLAAIDLLSSGDQVAGKTVAATGEIDLLGNIYTVGGIQQKTVAAKNAGAEVMFVPQGEARQAEKVKGDMKIIEVSNIKQALTELNKLGGDKVSRVRECAN